MWMAPLEKQTFSSSQRQDWPKFHLYKTISPTGIGSCLCTKETLLDPWTSFGELSQWSLCSILAQPVRAPLRRAQEQRQLEELFPWKAWIWALCPGEGRSLSGSAATPGSAPKTRTQLGLGKGESTNMLHTHPPHLGTAHPCLGIYPLGEKILWIWRPTNSCDCLGGMNVFWTNPEDRTDLNWWHRLWLHALPVSWHRMPPHRSEEGGNFFPERSLMGRGCPGRGWSAHPWRWHSGLDDKVGIGQSWNSVTWEGFSRLRDSGIPQKNKEVWQGERGSGRRPEAKGLWKTRSTFTSLPHFPFLACPVVLPLQHRGCRDSSQAQQRKTLLQGGKQFFKTCKASCFSFSHVVEPTNRFFPKKKLILTMP